MKWQYGHPSIATQKYLSTIFIFESYILLCYEYNPKQNLIWTVFYFRLLWKLFTHTTISTRHYQYVLDIVTLGLFEMFYHHSLYITNIFKTLFTCRSYKEFIASPYILRACQFYITHINLLAYSCRNWEFYCFYHYWYKIQWITW